MVDLFNSVIKSVNTSQTEILCDIFTLYLNGDSVECDITYSTGNFYGRHGDLYINQPKYKFDICPMDDSITKIEPWGNIPLEDDSIGSCVFDPPFVIAPRDSASVFENKENSNVIQNRFSSYYPVNELLDSYAHWMKEMYRILKDEGIAIVKCQPTVTGGRELNSHHFIWFIAECLGFDVVDEFVLTKNNRLISGKIKTQQHARKFHSYTYVLKKSTKKKITYLNFLSDDAIQQLLKGFINNNKGKNNGNNNLYKESVVPQKETMNKL